MDKINEAVDGVVKLWRRVWAQFTIADRDYYRKHKNTLIDLAKQVIIVGMPEKIYCTEHPENNMVEGDCGACNYYADRNKLIDEALIFQAKKDMVLLEKLSVEKIKELLENPTTDKNSHFKWPHFEDDHVPQSKKYTKNIAQAVRTLIEDSLKGEK